jgi:hypothetical protein
VNRLELMLGKLSATAIRGLEREAPETAFGLKNLLVDCPIISDKSEFSRVQSVVQEDLATGGDIPRWRQVEVENVSVTEPVYEQGYHLARLLRTRLGLGTGPIIDFATRVLNDLDVVLDSPRETRLFRTAVCAPPRGKAHILRSSSDPHMGHLTAARFAIAAALGRLLWSASVPEDRPVCAAHGDYARLIQTRRANAFAAELLLPSAAVESRLGPLPTDDQIADLAERYGISRSAARWHVHNAGFLPRMNGASSR